MKKYIIAILIFLSVNIAFAQDFFDALKYSQTEYGGTARSIAMGSAFGALGADFVSASINPAGLGFYRSGEFAFSPTLNLNSIESSYLGNNQSDNKYMPNINNLSYVTSGKTGAETGILNFTFGVGFNRLKNFNSNAFIQGFDANTTLLNYFTDYANEINDPNQFDYHYEGLAWNSYLIDEDQDPEVLEGIYYNNLSDYDRYDLYDENNNYIGIGYEPSGVKAHQQKSLISKTGHIDEYLLSMGLNMNHKIYFGATMGMVDLDYSENIMYSEIDNNNNIDYFKNYTLESYLTESGFGLNLKTGIIYRPVKPLRIGVSIHTPTFYAISRNEQKKMVANFDEETGSDDTGYSTKQEDQNEQRYDYRLETPFKTNLSAAYTIGDVALVSVDYELINYGTAKFRNAGDSFDYSGHNSDITNTLNTSGNLRIGGEYRLNSNFSLRAGYNLMGNPWKSTYTFNNGSTEEIINSADSFSSYSAGFGYRQQNFFIDFAYRMNQANYSYKVHEMYYSNPEGGSSSSTLNEINNQATLTFGFRF